MTVKNTEISRAVFIKDQISAADSCKCDSVDCCEEWRNDQRYEEAGAPNSESQRLPYGAVNDATGARNRIRTYDSTLANCEMRSLRSVKFTSLPCRPQLSMQRNEEFIVNEGTTSSDPAIRNNIFLKQFERLI
jgi:hypothetical protein